jgi:hypothetical protein
VAVQRGFELFSHHLSSFGALGLYFAGSSTDLLAVQEKFHHLSGAAARRSAIAWSAGTNTGETGEEFPCEVVGLNQPSVADGGVGIRI